MEGLFSDNQIAIYIIACIAVISYTNFKENQRMVLIYLFTYATALFDVFHILASVGLLLVISFVYLEYLSEDEKKLALITNVAYKVADYLFLMISQYHFLWVISAFVILHVSHYQCMEDYQDILRVISIIPLFVGAHLSISQPFKIKSITDMCRVFDECPPYRFEYREEMQKKFDLLCEMEDKTFLQRNNSYSSFSFEYAICILKTRILPQFRSTSKRASNNPGGQMRRKNAKRLLKRGFSTPEMQLIRTIGVVRGYDDHKYQRKIFEIIYSKLVFSSLKRCHEANSCSKLPHFRHYILFVYLQTVMTKIKDIRCVPLSSAFENTKDISNWSMNGLFVACLGLCFREVTESNLSLYNNVIEKFDLNVDRIKKLNELYPKKFPLEDA